ncbi:putative leader peptide [Saccharopolyspora griseoalba]|uniref:Leader peptide n=1 Tax=Saccharopolyspora griseoalba TaxID=1431848 RepID=A0ABW2LLY7_9PSEU
MGSTALRLHLVARRYVDLRRVASALCMREV